MRDHNIPVFAIKGEDNDTYYSHIMAAIDHKPHITMDDGADLVTCCTPSAKTRLDGVIGGTEETTTGVIRLRAMAKEGVLKLPHRRRQRCRHQAPFDNRYGTGQSTIDGIIRATNFLLAGSQVRGRRLRLVRTRFRQPRSWRRAPKSSSPKSIRRRRSKL